jgi:lipoprotein-releasing system ATP-binding protein
MRRFNAEQGTAFLVVTHDPRLAERCDRIIELIDGRIASGGMSEPGGGIPPRPLSPVRTP